jgi:hypothetical protein
MVQRNKMGVAQKKNFVNTVNPRYNGHNLAVKNWEFLEMLRH